MSASVAYTQQLKTLQAENEELRIWLEEAEQTLSAIRQGAVDALVIAGPQGDNVFTLAGCEHNYRLLIESIDEGVVTATQEGTILYCNSKFAQMVDLPVETLVGCRMTEFVKPSEKSSFESFLKTRSCRQEVTLRTLDGGEISTNISIGLLDADGLSGISLILTDLTETKMAASLLKVNSELSRSNSELAHFAFVASHDLKEPLRVISSYVQMLHLHHKDLFDETSSTYMTYVVDAVARMYALINDLLGYSRIGAERREFREVDCNEVLNDVVSNIETSLKECGGEIRYSRLPTVAGNRAELVQLLQNLLGNAIKYRSSLPPRIRIDARAEESHWLFSGVEASDFLYKRPPFTDRPTPDLILLDLNLPLKDGRELLKELKADPNLCKIPVIMLSTSNSETDISQAYSLGAAAFITKPPDVDAFQNIIRSLVEFWFREAELPVQVESLHRGIVDSRPLG